jgi:hypothetical protein
MIADSTYDAGELIARPRSGAAAGVVAAVVMLALLTGLAGPDSARAWIEGAAAPFLPAAPQTLFFMTVVGGLVHLGVGGLLGALYAACQQRTSTGGLVAVGVFYGFIVWLAGYVFLARLFQAGPSPLRTWPGLLALVGYGLVLAAWAARVQRASARLVQHARPVD